MFAYFFYYDGVMRKSMTTALEQPYLGYNCPRGPLPLEGGTGMCCGHDPHFSGHASLHSLDFQFTG